MVNLNGILNGDFEWGNCMGVLKGDIEDFKWGLRMWKFGR